MLWTTLLLVPLALARPHPNNANGLVQRRVHHERAAAATNLPLVERAGAAINNETRDEISAWRHSNDMSQQQQTSSPIASASGVQGVGTALSAVNTPSSLAPASSAVPTTAPEQEAESQVDTAQPSVVETVTSEDAQPETSAEAAAASASPSPSTESSVEAVPSSSSRSSITHTTVVTASRSSTVVRVTASSSASATAASSNDEPEKIAGLNKTTFIIIIVVAGVVALVAVGWTVFRKWKLRPSRRFDEKMRPIDFSPEPFAEKTHQRSSSNSSAAMHRRDLVAELDDPKHVAGVPDHDFTAGGNMAGHGAGAGVGVGAGVYDMYNQDPYAHAEAYEYDAAYDHYDDQRGVYRDQPTQDTGYADLHRGNSIGSGSGHGHGHGQQYPVESFPMPDHYLNRPTGADGPYGSSHRF